MFDLDNRKFLELSPLSYHEVLLTHAGQMDLSIADCLFLDWDLTTFDPDLPARSVTYAYFKQPNQAIKIDYAPYKTNLRLSQPVRLSSKARLSSSVAAENYIVVTNADESEVETRYAVYREPEDYNLFTYSRRTSIASGVAEYIYRDTQTAEGLLTLKTINKLPISKAYTYLLNDVTAATYTQGARYQALSKLYQSDVRDGLVPSSKVHVDMGYKNPANVAWALFYACAAQADLYVLLILRGLVEEAFRRGYIIRLAEGEIDINPNAYWGFEPSFLPGAAQDDSLRIISDNALLGWSVCCAIRYLQDRRPLDSNLIIGKYTDFDVALKQFVKSIGFLCAYAVSPVIWWSCERFESGAFNYEAVSLKASYLTDIFLNELLQITYEPFIHSQAARLHETISYSPDDLTNGFYTGFVDNSPDAQVYRLYWYWKYNEQVLSDLLAEYIPGGVNDSYIAYLYLATGETLPDWLETFLDSKQDVISPEEVDSLYDLDSLSYLPLCTGVREYAIKSSTNFYYYAHEASAKVSYLLSELRRLWPVGSQWTNLETLMTVTSVLGSMLYAEASLYYDFYLLYFLIRDGLSLDRAQGDQAYAWVDLFLRPKSMTTDKFIAALVYDYLNREINTHSDLEVFLREFFNRPELTLSHPTPKPYSVLKDPYLVEDDFWNYTAEVNEFNTSYFTEVENRSIIHKPGSIVDTSELYTIDTDDRVNAYGGYVERVVPGFPYRNCLVSFNTFNCSDTIPVNSEYYDMPVTERLMYRPYLSISDPDAPECSYDYWYNPDLYVLDGPSMLKPLDLYVPKSTIDLNGPLCPYLTEVLHSTMPAGLSYKVLATNYYIEVRNKVVTDIWFFDDADVLENTVFT
jgi:hypothetical protein